MKMQRVAPEIKQIQERYKKYKMNDPRKAEMNKEVMAIYFARRASIPLAAASRSFLQIAHLVWPVPRVAGHD